VTDLPIKVVLDATAVIAYARGSVAVGEVIAEITDEDAAFAIPEISLIEGARRLEVDQWSILDLLISHSHCVRLELPANWRDAAFAAQLLDGTSRAVAMLAAVDTRAYLLTAEPEVFGGDDALLVIGI